MRGMMMERNKASKDVIELTGVFANNHTEKGCWVASRPLFHTIFGLYIIEDLKLAPPFTRDWRGTHSLGTYSSSRGNP